jgi:chaperone required for assembly of F1-ATPase
LGATFVKASGIMHVTQPEAALNAVRKVLAGYDAWSLAPLHVMTTLTGSALIALAHAAGHLDLAAAWVAAHADEDWQIAQWGEDAEATARRDRRLGEMSAASRTLELL